MTRCKTHDWGTCTSYDESRGYVVQCRRCGKLLKYRPEGRPGKMRGASK